MTSFGKPVLQFRELGLVLDDELPAGIPNGVTGR
jgi:hypothetical protein